MSGAPERIWARFTEDFGAVQIGQWADSIRIEPSGIEYIRADVSAARIADLTAKLAEREAQVERLLAMQTDREVDHERQLAEARDKALDLARAAVQSALDGNPKYDAARLIARDAIRNLKGTP